MSLPLVPSTSTSLRATLSLYSLCVSRLLLQVEIISGTEDYINLLKHVFDFDAISKLTSRPDFKFYFDAQHGGMSTLSLSIPPSGWYLHHSHLP